MNVLQIDNLRAGYGDWPVLDGLELGVAPGTVLGIVGMNGAGKTTLLDVVAGRLSAMAGSVRVGGEDWTRLSTFKRIRRGMSYVPEGRGLVRDLTVVENLTIAAPGKDVEALPVVQRAYEMFPNLHRRRDTRAADLSGGEQQMLAITRAMVQSPRLLLLDEPTLGLAPIMVKTVAEFVRHAADQGATIVLAEQNVRFVEQLADRILLLRRGRLEELGSELGNDLQDFLDLESSV